MVCNNCKKELNNDTLVCPYCRSFQGDHNSVINSKPNQETAASAEIAETERKDKDKNSKKIKHINWKTGWKVIFYTFLTLIFFITLFTVINKYVERNKRHSIEGTIDLYSDSLESTFLSKYKNYIYDNINNNDVGQYVKSIVDINIAELKSKVKNNYKNTEAAKIMENFIRDARRSQWKDGKYWKEYYKAEDKIKALDSKIDEMSISSNVQCSSKNVIIDQLNINYAKANFKLDINVTVSLESIKESNSNYLNFDLYFLKKHDKWYIYSSPVKDSNVYVNQKPDINIDPLNLSDNYSPDKGYYFMDFIWVSLSIGLIVVVYLGLGKLYKNKKIKGKFFDVIMFPYKSVYMTEEERE